MAGVGILFDLFEFCEAEGHIADRQQVKEAFGPDCILEADGLCVMVWEVVCVVALVFMAWIISYLYFSILILSLSYLFVILSLISEFGGGTG